MYPNDILSSGRVAALSGLEELWYRRALDHGWMNGGMPIDPAEFAGWVGRGCTKESAAKIIDRFYVAHKKDVNKVVNNRQEKERTKFRQKLKQKSDAGKKGMAKRWKETGKADNGVITPLITEDNIPIPIPISREEEKKKEERREETPQAATTKKGSRIPDQFYLTSEMKEWAAEKRPHIDLAEETEKFCNHFRSKTGRDAAKLDWSLTWKNWILNARENNNGKSITHQFTNSGDRNAQRINERKQLVNDLLAADAAEQGLPS